MIESGKLIAEFDRADRDDRGCVEFRVQGIFLRLARTMPVRAFRINPV